FRRKRIPVLFVFLGLVFIFIFVFVRCSLRRPLPRALSGCRRLSLRLQSANAGRQKRNGHQQTKNKIPRSIHRFSSFISPEAFLSSIPCIILISARCPVSTSVAKPNNSASCPAPAVSNKSFTIVSAPL